MKARRATLQDLDGWVHRAQRGDLEAYDHIVRQFQDRAVGYGYSLLRDFQWAEDAAQEAFIQAFLDLSTLRDPQAFPGWFRKIVFKQCDRLARRKRVLTVSLEAAREVASPAPGPEQTVEEAARRADIRAEVDRLPGKEREVVALFYLGGCSHAEIGGFLELPITTVKKRLQTARQRLKERMMATDMSAMDRETGITRREALTAIAGTTAVLGMVGSDFQKHAPSRDSRFADQVQAAIGELHAPNPDHDVQKMPWHRLYAALEEQASAQSGQSVSDSYRALFDALLKETQEMYPDDPVLQAIPQAKDQETCEHLLVSVGQGNHATCRGTVLRYAPMQRKAVHLHDDLARVAEMQPTEPAPGNAVTIFNALRRAVQNRFADNSAFRALPEAHPGQDIATLVSAAARLQQAMEDAEENMTEAEREQPW